MADPVLIFDDEPRILESLGRLIEKEGWRAFLAKDGAAAEAILSREPGIALALLDVALPGEDGLSILARWTREHPGSM
jgi:DNA-binding response OmpR family regulator